MKRKIKVADVKDLLISHIEKIKNLATSSNFSDDLEENSIIEEFNLFSKALNKFTILDEELINLYIDTFKIIPNKKVIFSNFLSI